jgi:indolepyruvate ferredoxin oxidoreductase beta subunit
VTLLIGALGGEGGGVLADWVLAAAAACDFPAQSTSIPGVSQRTGATTYYLEVFPVASGGRPGPLPVFALTPSPGHVDLMVASELVEAGRALQNGYVSPRRTTLVASTHRVYATSEKMAPGDGRYPAERVLEAAQALAARAVLLDMAALAERAGTVINAVLFGAMCGSGALPLAREACEGAIRASGKAAEASLRGFAAGWDAARAAIASPAGRALPATGAGSAPVAPAPGGAEAPAREEGPAAGPAAGDAAPGAADSRAAVTGPLSPVLPEPLRRALDTLPDPARALAAHGAARLVDYQDARYALRYLERLQAVARAEREAGGDGGLAADCARYLALWMSYEDVVRVADLKSRRARLERVRSEAGARPDEPLHLTEFLKPGTEELAGVLPGFLAAPLRRWGLRGGRDRLSRAVQLRTSSVSGFLALRLLAALRAWRPHSTRFAAEQAEIDRWLDRVRAAAARSLPLAREIAECARLLKGYGTTHARGRAQFDRILGALAAGEGVRSAGEQAAAIRQAREAALAEPTGRALAQALGEPWSPPVQPIRWMKPPRRT